MELARQHTKDSIERLVAWMRSDNPKASVTAAQALLDRGYGKPGQAVALTDPEGNAMTINLVNYADKR